MRIRFAGYVTIGVVSAFLVVASYGFADGTFKWLAFAGGIALALLGAIETQVSRNRPAISGPAALVAALGIAMAVLAVVLGTATAADWGFGLAIATGALSVLGLAAHELAVERDIHELDMPASGHALP
jgi:peptidoglycan/LPS O-acetylase OafA/YrhL